MTDSPFSNPSASTPDQVRDYIRDLLALLGDRDPIAVLEAMVPALEERVAAHDEATLRRPEAPGKWSVGQVIQHLADSEIVVGYRLRVTLAEDEPAIPGYDQDLWAQRLGYADASVEAALDQFRALRRVNLPVWRGLTPDDLRRFGHHAERGVETIDQLLKLYAAHDLVHLRQIDRILGTMLK
jgi:hypothetical protein